MPRMLQEGEALYAHLERMKEERKAERANAAGCHKRARPEEKLRFKEPW